MRETFYSLGSLLKYYEYLKLNVVSIPAMMPKKDSTRNQQYSAFIARSNKEEKFALICDVENFPKNYFNTQENYIKISIECLIDIFNCGYLRELYPNVPRYQSWGRLALYFHREIMKNKRLPRKLKYASNLCVISKDMWKKCEIYFKEKKIIVERETEEAL